MKLTENDIHRFEKKVDMQPGKCWEWRGSLIKDGYGRFWAGRRLLLAHRVAYFIANKQITPGKLILHECDNPSCCNPTHLFEGTQRDNVYDCIRKHRRARLMGESHGRSKFTEEEIAIIRGMHRLFKIPKKQISLWCGVTDTSIHQIITKRHWSHI
jgi:hypothetical protein